MHQWKYKDKHIRAMLDSSEDVDRARVVRTAIEASDGRLLAFYLSFGEYDGLAISEFANELNALSCAMLLVGQGRIQTLHTTTLFTQANVTESIKIARSNLSQGGAALAAGQ
jgi:uncharacterized protein with GYD domain